MQGIELAYADTAFQALRGANVQLRESSLSDVVSPADLYGKGDTFGFDAIPEIAIATVIDRFDRDILFITEELGGRLAGRIRGNSVPTMFFCDPTDRSAQLHQLLEDRARETPTRKTSDVLTKDIVSEWEERFGAPASITGSTSAITCVRGGQPVFSVILNYITQEAFIVCDAGIRALRLPDHTTPRYDKLCANDILLMGREVTFPYLGNRNHGVSQKFVTFLKKRGYPENFRDSHIFGDGEEREPIYDAPGGPTRSFYLSSLSDQPLGFILANGEKIGEWIHWLTVQRFARHRGEPSLRVFEVCQERPWTREGILTAPPPFYSIFRKRGDDEGSDHVWIDVQPLRDFPRPSQYRATLVLDRPITPGFCKPCGAGITDNSSFSPVGSRRSRKDSFQSPHSMFECGDLNFDKFRNKTCIQQ